jgi:CBS domain containing-hemolysin-like protein
LDLLLTLIAGIAVVVLITALTGYFVAQEFAYMAVDRTALNVRADAGDSRAATALTITSRTSFMLSGAQLGITVTGLLVGYVAEPMIGASIGTALGGISIPAGVSLAIGAVIALTFSTLVQMLFGELFPKNLAIARAEPTAIALAGSTRVYLAAFGWLIRIFDASSNALLRLFRIEPVHDVEHSASARDLEHIVEESRESGQIPDELSALLDRILDFPEQTVQHAMIPRTKADVISSRETIGQVRELMSTGHSRYPVLASNGEDVLGVVHLVDVLATDEPDSASVRTVMRPAPLVSTVMSLPEALSVLNESADQLACVVDEYGGFSGVLSLEDLAEEIVGEITDEHDIPQIPHHFDGVGWVMPGDTPVDEAERALDISLPEGDYETIAGMVIAARGGFPSAGETVMVTLPIDTDDFLDDEHASPRRAAVQILEIERHVPALVRITVGEQDSDTDIDPDSDPDDAGTRAS